MKILLIGEYYSYNLGDPLLCRTVEKLIASEYPQAEITPFDMSGKAGFDEFFVLEQRSFSERCMTKIFDILSGVFTQKPFWIKYSADRHRHLATLCSLLRVLRKNDFDLAVFAGGSIFMNYFSSIIYLIINILNLKRIKVIFHACGTSSMDDVDIALFAKALKKRNIRSISLRDSYEQFTDLFTPSCPVIKTFDTALMSSKLYPAAASVIAEHGICIVGREEFYEAQKSFVRYMMNSGRSFRLYTNGEPKDQLIAEELLADLGIAPTHYDQYLLPLARDENELIQQVTSFRHIYSYRMHSLIIASSFGIRHFGFVSAAKIPMFYHYLNADKWCTALEPNSNFDDILNIAAQPIENLSSLVEYQAGHSKACLLSSIAQYLK